MARFASQILACVRMRFRQLPADLCLCAAMAQGYKREEYVISTKVFFGTGKWTFTTKSNIVAPGQRLPVQPCHRS